MTYNHILVKAKESGNRDVHVAITREELADAVLRQACSMIREWGIPVFAQHTFVTDVDTVFLSNDDLEPLDRLVIDHRIAALIDAANTLRHGNPLRPVVRIGQGVS